MHLLLVDPDAEPHAARLARPGLDITLAATLLEARAYLSGAAFDAVTVRQGPMADPLGRVHQSLGLGSLFHVHADPDALEAWVDRRVAPTGLSPAPPDATRPAPPDAGGGDADGTLPALREEIGRIVHALNNPLAVIAGNAQLGAEMGRVLGVDPSLVSAFEDIGDAATRLGGLFDDVRALRSRIDALEG